MSTDRELLELAAKAAGIPVTPGCHIPSGGLWLFNVDVDRVWSLLHDDGDALRLAVKLNLVIYISPDEVDVLFPPAGYPDGEVTIVEKVGSQFHSISALSATRRAIVRAAAEIGRELP